MLTFTVPSVLISVGTIFEIIAHEFLVGYGVPSAGIDFI